MDVTLESIRNQVDLSLKLAKHVFSTEARGDSNLVFSPLSINVILSLIVAGSDSPTRDQLLAFLKSDSIDDLNTFYSHIVGNILVDGSLIDNPSLSVANELWILFHYASLVKYHFHGVLTPRRLRCCTLSDEPSSVYRPDAARKSTWPAVNFVNGVCFSTIVNVVGFSGWGNIRFMFYVTYELGLGGDFN